VGADVGANRRYPAVHRVAAGYDQASDGRACAGAMGGPRVQPVALSANFKITFVLVFRA
jgi:hypothetical protein